MLKNIRIFTLGILVVLLVFGQFLFLSKIAKATVVTTEQARQSVDLEAGWNYISFNVLPEETSLENIFAPLVEEGSLEKVMDERGNSFENLLGTWYSSIDYLNIREGLMVKANQDTTLQITGTAAYYDGSNWKIELDAGWNLLGYPSNTRQSAYCVLKPLIDNGSLDKIVDEDENPIFYHDGERWMNKIGKMNPADGYYIRLHEPGTVLINESIESTCQLADLVVENAVFSPATMVKGQNYNGEVIVTIKNIGSTDANFIQDSNQEGVSVYIYSTVAGLDDIVYVDINELKAGDSVEVVLPVVNKVFNSVFPLTVLVDGYYPGLNSNNQVEELNDNNNYLVKDVYPSDTVSEKPDLYNKNFFYDEETGNFQVEYCNYGDISTDDIFYIKMSGNGEVYSGNGYYSYSMPGPGKCIVAPSYPSSLFNMSAGDQGYFTTELDWDNKIDESNENNNLRAGLIILSENNKKPDLIISDITNENETIKINVCNDGEASTGATPFYTHINTNGVSLRSYDPISDLAPGACAIAGEYPVSSFGLSGSGYALFAAWTDWREYIVESDEDNNRLRPTLYYSDDDTPAPDPVIPKCESENLDVIQENALGGNEFQSLGLDISSHPEIMRYRIQWSGGGWSPWYTPGYNDVDWKDESRRIWSYFDDHKHEYEKCLGDDSSDDDTASPTGKLSDFTISNIDFILQDPQVGKKTIVIVGVTNEGDIAGKAALKLEHPGAELISKSDGWAWGTKAIGPKQSRYYTYYLEYGEAGEYIITATADPENEVVEYDEDNNSKDKTFAVLAVDAVEAVRPEIISHETELISDTSVTISWSTDIPTQGKLGYKQIGLDRDFAHTFESATISTTHEIILTGLTAPARYHYVITAYNPDSVAIKAYVNDSFETPSNVMPVYQNELSKQAQVKKVKFQKIKSKVAERLRGRLLLAVENKGRVYYVHPENAEKHEITFGNLMPLFRKMALGISNQDLNTIPVNPESLSDDEDTDGDGYSDKDEAEHGYNPYKKGTDGSDKMKFRAQTYNRLKGRILIQAEDRGQIWYVDEEGKRWEVTWDNAMNLFRKLSLGINNQDLEEIEDGD